MTWRQWAFTAQVGYWSRCSWPDATTYRNRQSPQLLKPLLMISAKPFCDRTGSGLTDYFIQMTGNDARKLGSSSWHRPIFAVLAFCPIVFTFSLAKSRGQLQ